MARISSRRWKGCQLCKPHQHPANGAACRIPAASVGRGHGGKVRRLSLHDIPSD